MNYLKKLTFIGVIFVSVLGTVWHFVYKWTGNNFIAGFFFPINESTWEHMKLCFFPMLIYSFYMNKKLKAAYPCITASLPLGILSGTLSIPVIFYTYSGILGYHSMFFDIAVFIISVLFAFFTIYKLSLSCKSISCTLLLKLCVLVLAVCFLIFTYHPPGIGIFADPAG